MIRAIKSELRKSRRPAVLVSALVLAAITILFYSANWYIALHPGNGPREAVSLLTLYPDQFVNNIMGAAFPIGAAVAIVLGAIFAGSEYGWNTLKGALTQGPGRLTVWAGRIAVFLLVMALMAAVLFVVGAGYSVVIASVENHAITWPAFVDAVKGFSAMWLVLSVNGSIGLALGVLIRQSAAALGIGLTYVLAVEIIAVRFINVINNGQYKWITDNFVNQNANALTQTFTSPAFGPRLPSVVSAEHAVAVLFAYGIGLLVISAGLLRLRDVT
jgi:ABC-type transport system involved in multi-copper enzyme maturation permease subunit